MYQAVRTRIENSRNRGIASGGARKREIKRDGSESKTLVSVNTVQSGIMGYFDRYARYPYCRKTAFLERHWGAFQACMPALREADRLFAEHAPAQHAAQARVAAATHPDFIIPGTCFTTITLNRNFRTGYHRDAGDFAEGFGVMTLYRGGRFRGGHLCFPAWRVAAALDSFDCILFDPHELHGNTAIEPLRDDWERITCVHYYRANMHYCGSAAEELELVRRHDPRRGPRNLNVSARELLET